MLKLGKRLSIKSKLMFMVLGASLGSILILGILSWQRSKTNLRESTNSHLTSIRASKAFGLETYFQNLRDQIEILCEDRTIVSAMAEFNRGYDTLDGEYGSDDWNNAIAEFYNKEFFPQLSKSVSGELNVESYTPKSQAGKYLQYYYIVKNSNPIGKKNELLDAGEGSEYSKTHAKYHDFLRHLANKFGYYNIFLIDSKSGDIVYSVSKETDYGTSLNDGPYRESNLAQIVEAVRKNPERRTVQIVDFQSYRPSYGKPAAFIAGPIYNGPHAIGILAVQIPVDRINNIMLGKGDRQDNMQGKTEETYVVGPDLLMRSDSRFLKENPEGYKKSLPASGTPQNNIRSIDEWGTSVLLQYANTLGVRRAIAGQQGIDILQNYRGKKVLSSYAPLTTPGLNWAILSEIELDEADQPVAALQAYMLIVAVILIVLVTWGSMVAAASFLKPLNKLSKGLDRINKGDVDFDVKRESDDELGEMADALDRTVTIVRQQTESIAEKDRQNKALLLNIMPAPVAERLEGGEQQVVDSAKLATVLFAHIKGIAEMSLSMDAKEIGALLNILIGAFDDATSKYDVGKIKTLGDRYIAACGVTTPRLDHTKLMMDFALEMFSILQRFNNEQQTQLSLHIGIDDGPVMAGIVGTKKFSYDLWGETLSVANFLQLNAQANTILVTQEVYERLQELYKFERGEDLVFSELKQTLITWVFKKPNFSWSDSKSSDIEDTSSAFIQQI